MKPPTAGNPAGLNAPASLLFLDGTLSDFLLYFLYLAGCVFLFLLPAAQVIGVFQFDSPCCLIPCLIIVKHTVDAFIRG